MCLYISIKKKGMELRSLDGGQYFVYLCSRVTCYRAVMTEEMTPLILQFGLVSSLIYSTQNIHLTVHVVIFYIQVRKEALNPLDK